MWGCYVIILVQCNLLWILKTFLKIENKLNLPKTILWPIQEKLMCTSFEGVESRDYWVLLHYNMCVKTIAGGFNIDPWVSCGLNICSRCLITQHMWAQVFEHKSLGLNINEMNWRCSILHSTMWAKVFEHYKISLQLFMWLPLWMWESAKGINSTPTCMQYTFSKV